MVCQTISFSTRWSTSIAAADVSSSAIPAGCDFGRLSIACANRELVHASCRPWPRNVTTFFDLFANELIHTLWNLSVQTKNDEIRSTHCSISRTVLVALLESSTSPSCKGVFKNDFQFHGSSSTACVLLPRYMAHCNRSRPSSRNSVGRQISFQVAKSVV